MRAAGERRFGVSLTATVYHVDLSRGTIETKVLPEDVYRKYPGGSALASEAMWQSARRLAKEKPLIISIGSMAASVAWTLANRDTLLVFGGWLAAEAGQWAWVGVRGTALTLMEQPWFAGFRGLLDAPGRLALASAFGTLVYVTGVLALRRLLTVPAPTQRVAHANW